MEGAAGIAFVFYHRRGRQVEPGRQGRLERTDATDYERGRTSSAFQKGSDDDRLLSCREYWRRLRRRRRRQGERVR